MFNKVQKPTLPGFGTSFW